MNIQEAVAMLQIYIHIRTGKEVEINVQQFQDPRRLIMLQVAMTHVNAYFVENNVKFIR